MSVRFYPNGIGGTAPGDTLDLVRPLQATSGIIYVSSLIGTDAAIPAGQNREKPLATIAQAITNASAGDIIVFLPGHTETLTAAQNIASSLTLIGEGVTGGKPAVNFLNNSAAAAMFNVTGAGVEFRNIYFPGQVQANSTAKIIASTAATDLLVKGCYFDCAPNDNTQLRFSGARTRLESSTFISTATLTSAQPYLAISCGAAALGTFTINDVVVSSGTVGFGNYWAIDLALALSVEFKVERLSLLLGADMFAPAAATGRVNVQTATGGSRVDWA